MGKQLRVSIDSSVLIDLHKKPTNKKLELDALRKIFSFKKATGTKTCWFIYLDAVRREIGSQQLDTLSREIEIQDLLPYFDQVVSLSRVPMIIPVIVVGEEHSDAIQFFESKAISKKDAQVLADAVYLRSQFLITTDMRILRNQQATTHAYTEYELTILNPSSFWLKISGLSASCKF
jgi:hypothetical protein